MELTEKGREARRKYQADWLARNKDKRAAYLKKYWDKKADEAEPAGARPSTFQKEK